MELSISQEKENNAKIAKFLGYSIDESDRFFSGIYYYKLINPEIPYSQATISNVRSITDGFVWNYKRLCERRYDNDFSLLMDVVEYIESLDLKEWMYQWPDNEDENEVRYNFEGISVEIENHRCWIYINLALDPMMTINVNSLKKSFDTKFEAVYVAVLEFIDWYNERLERECQENSTK